MYIGSRTKTRVQERLKSNCPCFKVREENGELQPLCFLVYVRALNHNLSGLRNPDKTIEPLKPEEIMFCQTATGCFDNSYPGHVRDRVEVTGWAHVTERSIFKLMDCLYWFRRYKNQYNFVKIMTEYCQRRGIRALKHAVTQSFHSINSLLVKKLMAFSPEIEGYAQMAKHTAWAFAELFKDYSADSQVSSTGVVIEPTSGFYQDCKYFSSLVKESFHKQLREDRMAWLDPKPSTKAFAAFFGSELRRFKAYVEQQYSSSGSDYTLSPAWIFRASTLSQTRGMGYLPEAIAECKRTVFRMTINRPLVNYPARLTRLQYLAVQERLSEGGIAPAFLSAGRMGKFRDDETRKLFEDTFSRIEMVLKGSASVDTFVKDGGKLEDARLLLNLAIKHKWKVPIRNLDDHSIEGFIEVVRETDSESDYSRPLFWLSYQLIINHWVHLEQWPEKDEYPFLISDGTPYRPRVMDAKIVHISEPGKERNLTKSHACLAWFLTPASKITQGTLAHLPEHRAGLLESGHEWRHQKRISALSDESGFIYDNLSGKTLEEIVHIFKDWTESTDFICKAVGWAHLKGLFDYIAFPAMYARLVLKTIVEPQPVSEVTHRTYYEGGDIIEPIEWSGSINEGFMMGNPMTKTILHLVHSSELQISKEFLRRRGLRFRDNYKLVRFPDQARLDRDESQKDRTTIVTL